MKQTILIINLCRHIFHFYPIYLKIKSKGKMNRSVLFFFINLTEKKCKWINRIYYIFNNLSVSLTITLYFIEFYLLVFSFILYTRLSKTHRLSVTFSYRSIVNITYIHQVCFCWCWWYTHLEQKNNLFIKCLIFWYLIFSLYRKIFFSDFEQYADRKLFCSDRWTCSRSFFFLFTFIQKLD